MNSALYDVAVRISVQTAALQAGVALATRLFGQIETAAAQAESKAASAFSRMGGAHQQLAQATLSSEAAQIRYNRALTDYNRISSLPTANQAQMDAAQARLDLAQISQQKANLSRTTAQNAVANAQGAYGAASAAAIAAQEKQDRMARGTTRIMQGAVTAGVGLGLGALLVGTVKKALALSVVDTGISAALTDASGQRLSSGANAATMAALQKLEVGIGLTNQMSVTDVAHIVSAAQQAGMTRSDVLVGTKTQASILPSLANLAEVLKMTRGYSPDQSASIGAEYAHLFGAWQPAQFTQMVNLLGRALTVSPSSPQEFLTLTSQFAGTLRPLYGTSAAGKSRFITDAITTAALESELGQQTRGGTQLARMITREMGAGSGKMTSAQNTGLAQMFHDTGIRIFDPKTGAFAGVSRTIEAIALEAKKLNNPLKEGQLFQQVFGLVGARQAGLVGDPTTLARLGVLTTMLGPNGLPSLQAIQQQYNQSPQGQINQAQANWQTFITLFGNQLLPALTKAVPLVANFTRSLVQFASANPGLLKLIAGFAALSAVVLTVSGAIAIISGIFTVLGGIASVAGTVASVLAGVLGVIVAITGAPIWLIVAIGVGIAAAIVALIKFHDQIGAFIHGILGFLHLLPTSSQPSPFTPGTAAPAGSHGHWETIGAGKSGQIRRWVPDPPPNTHVPPPPGHTRPGIGGGGRSVPIVINVNGADHATTEDLAKRLMAHIGAALGHDTYYGSIGLGGSLEPGMGGY